MPQAGDNLAADSWDYAARCDLADRLHQCSTVVIVEHLIKAFCCPEYECHSLLDIRQIRKRVVTKTDGALVFDTLTLTGEGQLNSLSNAGRKPSDVGCVVATQQRHQLPILVNSWLENVVLLMPG